jgi:hypothetical protein
LPINIQLSKTSKHHPAELQVPRMNIENRALNTGNNVQSSILNLRAKLAMEMIGFEPTASAVQVRRSPN